MNFKLGSIVIGDLFLRMAKDSWKTASESSNTIIYISRNDHTVIETIIEFCVKIPQKQPELGEIENITHKNIMRNQEPIRHSQYRRPHDLYEKKWAVFNLYQKEGIIRKGKGKGSAPV